jgi:SAM-dependent methyltransferase
VAKIKRKSKKNKLKKIMFLAKEALVKPNEIFPFIIMKLDSVHMKITKNSIFKWKKELSMCSLLPNKMMDEMLKIYKPKSILDIGCGTGKAIGYFLKKGVPTVVGVEGSQMAIDHSDHSKLIKKHNLNKELNLKKKFDLVYSFEFIEHIHEDYADNVLKTFSNHSDIIVLTAAKPGASGQGHFNCQPKEYWIEKFSKYGYKFNPQNTLRLKKCRDIFWENILVFEKVKRQKK